MSDKMYFVVYLALAICMKSLMASPISTSTYASTGVIEPHTIKLNNTPTPKEEKTKNPENQSNLEVKEAEIEFHDTSDDDEEEEGVMHKSTTEDISRLSSRCQQLYKLLFANKQHYKSPNYEQYGDENRPIYVTSPRPTTRPTTTRPNSFYITVPSANNRQTIPVTAPIKYIRLEPVILQKTILSNGKTVYYWHKSLPTAVEYPQRYPETVAKEESHQGGYENFYNPYYSYYYYPQLYPGGLYYPTNQNVDKKPQETTTETSTTTTTTTTEESGFGLSNIFPFYGSSSIDTTTTTTEPPTTVSTKSTEDFIHHHPLRFMVPVPYDEGLTRSPWGYQPYNYYQKTAPQYYGNYRLPYNTNYQYARTFAESTIDDKVNEAGDVSR